MAAAQVDASPPSALVGGLSPARHFEPVSTRETKRLTQSPMRPERRSSVDKSSTSRSSGYRSPSPAFHDSRLSPPDMTQSVRYPSVQSSASASGTVTGGSSSSRGVTGDDTLTLRRREANRLAAQRFRSRKKGYQDSLEERIRILEEEKDAMTRRLDVGHQPSPREEGYFRHHDMYRRRSVSPDKGVDADIRVASLEAANRRLQDELRGVVEENERMRDELDRWRRWERELREPRRDEDRYSRSTSSTLPPLEIKNMPPPPYPASPYPSYPAHSPHPPLERGHSYTSASSRHPPSPGPRLPPLRLPHEGGSPFPHGRPLLPRPESMERLNNGAHALPPSQTSPTSRRD